MRMPPFVDLDTTEDDKFFPGAFTKLLAGGRQIEAGDILLIQWDVIQGNVANEVIGRIQELDYIENPQLLALDIKVTLEEGWYMCTLESILTPEPGSEEDVDGNSVLSFTPKVKKATSGYTWTLSTNDVPGWQLFVCGASSEERNEYLRQRAQLREVAHEGPR